MFCVEALRNACRVMVDKGQMEERVAVAKRTSQRGLAQGIMSKASRNGQPWTEVEEVEEGVDKYNQKEMVSEITDSWWNPVKVDDKAWQPVARLSLWRFSFAFAPAAPRVFINRRHHQHHQHHRPGNPDETSVSLCKAVRTIP